MLKKKKSRLRFHRVSELSVLEVALHVKMFLFASLMVLFVGSSCNCIWEVPDAIIKEMFLWMGPWQMNVSLQRQRKELSPHPNDLGRYTSQRRPWPRSPMSHLPAFLHHAHGYAQIHSISLKCLGYWSVSSGGERCWGETAITETSEDSIPALSGFLCGLWVYSKLASENIKMYSSTIIGH